jgi:hypothetical protein
MTARSCSVLPMVLALLSMTACASVQDREFMRSSARFDLVEKMIVFPIDGASTASVIDAYLEDRP